MARTTMQRRLNGCPASALLGAHLYCTAKLASKSRRSTIPLYLKI